MDEEEKTEFKNDIVARVNQILVDQAKSNCEHWDKVNADLTHRIEVTLPTALKAFKPKVNRLFPLFLAVVNGSAVGLSIFLAMRLFGA